MGFVHLHLHTEYSLLDGTTQVKKLFPHLKKLGMNAVAITEHGNMLGCIEKYKQAKKNDIKLIFGMEAYITDDIKIKNKNQKRYHLILLAKNITGYHNLIKLSSIANGEGFYYKPRIDKETLKKYSDGLIATTACLGNDIAKAIVSEHEDKAKKLIQEYIDIFGKENFFLEIERHNIKEEEIVLKKYKEYAKEFDLQLIATNDSHYLEIEDKFPHEIMLCLQTNSTIDDPKHFRFNGDGYYVKSESEMKELFKDIPEAIDNTVKISEMCNVELELDNPVFPDYEAPKGKTFDSYIRELCEESLEKIYKNSKLYQEAKIRMNYELSVITKMGFSAYFLIVYDFIKYAKNHCQVGPGRGSGAGSIVAYLLGITQLEPLSLKLLFERFLNPDRISLPDFDVDFGDKDLVLDYIKKKYGEEKVALIGTFGTMMAKAVLKDVARVMNIPFTVSNELTKFVTEKTIDKSLKISTELNEYQRNYPDLFFVAKRLEGCVRHTGIHACGVVWGKKPITEVIPVMKRHGLIVTQLDKVEVENAGLVKFDLLGLETLNQIKKTLDFAKLSNDFIEKIPLDDDKIYDMLRQGKSIGVFQLESGGMQKTLKGVLPTEFSDLIAIVALYRPGSMDFIDVYSRRKHGKEKVKYPDKKAEQILKETYGIIVYQEQVMHLSQKLAGFTMGEADVLRKAIGKKILKLMESQEAKFKEGCKNNTDMEKKTIDELWATIVKFASYSFNKSHAAAYALISYRTAYLKYYYPVEFMTAVISSFTSNPEKMALYLEAARNEGMIILAPNVNKSDKNFTVQKNNKDKKCIRFGLSGIKNVGDAALDEIIKHRPFKSFQDFVDKVDLSKVNKRVLHSLIATGCFDGLGHNRAQLLAVYDKVKKDNGKSTQMTLFGAVATSLNYPDINDLPIPEKLKLEHNLIGVYVSAHPLDLYLGANNPMNNKLDNLRDNTDVSVIGLVKDFRKIVTKNGDDMAFLKIKDKTGEARVVIFPNLFEDKLRKKNMTEDTCVLIEGKYKEENIIANDIKFPPMKRSI